MQLPFVSARNPQPSSMIRTSGVFLSINKLSILNERQRRFVTATIRTNAQSFTGRAVKRSVARFAEARVQGRAWPAVRAAFRRDHMRRNLLSRAEPLSALRADHQERSSRYSCRAEVRRELWIIRALGRKKWPRQSECLAIDGAGDCFGARQWYWMH